MSHPPTVRAACARLAAVRRWRPDDTAAITEARRDLAVAQAAALTALPVLRDRPGLQRGCSDAPFVLRSLRMLLDAA